MGQKFEDEVEELIGSRPDSWNFKSWEQDNDGHAYLWFRNSKGEDVDGQPLAFEQLQQIDAEYGIVAVESASWGETSSRLCIEIADP